MVHKGQKFRKVGARGVWEVIGPRQNLLGRTLDEHEDQWFLVKEGGGKVESVHERDLESGTAWSIVSDNA